MPEFYGEEFLSGAAGYRHLQPRYFLPEGAQIRHREIPLPVAVVKNGKIVHGRHVYSNMDIFLAQQGIPVALAYNKNIRNDAVKVKVPNSDGAILFADFISDQVHEIERAEQRRAMMQSLSGRHEACPVFAMIRVPELLGPRTAEPRIIKPARSLPIVSQDDIVTKKFGPLKMFAGQAHEPGLVNQMAGHGLSKDDIALIINHGKEERHRSGGVLSFVLDPACAEAGERGISLARCRVMVVPGSKTVRKIVPTGLSAKNLIKALQFSI